MDHRLIDEFVVYRDKVSLYNGVRGPTANDLRLRRLV